MSGQLRMFLKVIGVSVLVALAGWFLIARYNRSQRVGENSAEVWFYDPQNRQLYPVPRDTVPPDSAGRGGVRAVVVAFRGEENESRKRRIAYLETYGPPLKEAMERVRLARRSGKASKEVSPTRDSPLFKTNDMVRRVDETEWHVAGSPEGRKITAEWGSWRSPTGHGVVVCLP